MSGGRIAIVGGGISGLAAAHRIGELAREGSGPAEVTLFEAGDRLGGHLRTIRSGDLLVEAGPDQLVTHKPAGLDLVRRLGLADELIEIRGPRFAPRVLHRGRPTPLPDGFAMVAPTSVGALLRSRLFSWRAKARIAMSSPEPELAAMAAGLDGFTPLREWLDEDPEQRGARLLFALILSSIDGLLPADMNFGTEDISGPAKLPG